MGGETDGNLVYPTVIRDAKGEMAGLQEEVFGPVVFVSAFDTAAEVLARTRNNHYGQRAAVFGGSEAKATARDLVGRNIAIPSRIFPLANSGRWPGTLPTAVDKRVSIV